jgi:hypothetical protein
MTIDTLGALAKRGDQEATRILRQYIGGGFNWESALYELGETQRPWAWDGLDQVIRDRFHDDPMLEREWPWVSGDEPWKTWRRNGGPLAPAIEALLARQGKGGEEDETVAMTTDELLDWAERKRRLRIKALEARNSANDTNALLAAVDISRPWRAAAALTALAPRADPRVLPLAKGIIEQFRFSWWMSKARRHPLVLRPAAAKALAALPSHLVLPLARQWRSSSQRKFRKSAYTMLETHATVDDLSWVRKQLRKPISDQRIYQFCDLAEIIERFPEKGPFRPLRRIYRDFPYSYGRHFVVKAMAATDPAFPGTIAYECLWDCQGQAREVASQYVDLSGARARVQELAGDPFEDSNVRQAAARRLNT